MPSNSTKKRFLATKTNSNLVPGTKKVAFNAKKGTFSDKNDFGVVNGVVDFDTFQQAKMRRKPYKSFTIVRCTPTEKYPQGEWYVEYRYEVPGKPFTYKPVKKRGNLNSITDPVKREYAAKALQRDIIAWLDAGNMPKWAYKIILEMRVAEVEDEIKEEIKNENWSLETAIRQYRIFVKGHGYSDRTISTYKCYVDDFEGWLKDAGLIHTKAKDFTELDLRNILEEVYEQLEWSPRTYNNNFEFFGSFFKRCEKLEKQIHDRRVRYDFDISLVDLKITTPQVNKAYTPALQQKLKAELSKPGYEDMYDYIAWIELSLMRPKEIRALKVEHIDLDSRHIRILGKTGDRLIPLSDQLIDILIKRGIKQLDTDNYIFGRKLHPSKDKCGINYPLEEFAKLRKKLHLGPEYRPYSSKPTGVIKMINAGFSDKEIMVLTGHKTQDAFEKYKRDLVIDNSHSMKGKTIDF